MKQMKRVMSLLLVAAMVAAVLAGCSAPQLMIGGTPKTVGTIAGREIATGEYLAYMFIEYNNMNLYQWSQYGMDVWAQNYSYGEGDAAQNVPMDEYLRLAARDSMIEQEAIRQLLDKYGLKWDDEKLKELEEEINKVSGEAWLPLGISREHMVEANKNVSLNRNALLMGLYGKGGKRAIAETELKQYFDKNYLSYKYIPITLTDEDDKELSADKKKVETDRLKGYLDEYNKTKNFEKIVDAYAQLTATSTDKIEPSKDEDNRVDVDATDATLDQSLMTEVRKIKVGEAAVVEYKANGSTPTAALILRLDTNDPAKNLFEKANEKIITSLKAEELDKEIEQQVKTVVADLKKSAMKKCKPQNFEAVIG